MEEVLVAFACLMNKGCTDTSQAYYASHAELSEIVKKQEIKIRDTVPPIVIQYIAPIMVMSYDKKFSMNIRLTKYWSMKYSRTNATLSYAWSFE